MYYLIRQTSLLFFFFFLQSGKKRYKNADSDLLYYNHKLYWLKLYHRVFNNLYYLINNVNDCSTLWNHEEKKSFKQ